MSADRSASDFGSKLREARERRGVTLRQIANATKIAVGVLDALERNDISRLPGGIFGRGFVRSYAIEVGLDPEKTIQDFIAQFPHDSVTQGHPPSERNEDNEAVESDRRLAGTFLSLIAISIPIGVAVLYFGTGAARRSMRERPATAGAGVARTSDVRPPAEGSPLPASAIAAASPQATSLPTSTPASSAAASRPAVDVLTIGLSVKRPCWVSAMVDGQKTIDQLLPAGDRRSIDVRSEIVLTAADAAAVDLTLNGAGARPLGKSGDAVTVRLTLSNFQDYVQAR
jgi:cytoskeleton protein RodZ